VSARSRTGSALACGTLASFRSAFGRSVTARCCGTKRSLRLVRQFTCLKAQMQDSIVGIVQPAFGKVDAGISHEPSSAKERALMRRRWPSSGSTWRMRHEALPCTDVRAGERRGTRYIDLYRARAALHDLPCACHAGRDRTLSSRPLATAAVCDSHRERHTILVLSLRARQTPDWSRLDDCFAHVTDSVARTARVLLWSE
jgi:hypothetical protein